MVPVFAKGRKDIAYLDYIHEIAQLHLQSWYILLGEEGSPRDNNVPGKGQCSPCLMDGLLDADLAFMARSLRHYGMPMGYLSLRVNVPGVRIVFLETLTSFH